MRLPSTYANFRETLPDEVNFGCGGIKLFSVAELPEAQIGYSVDVNGASLCSDDLGAWRPNWLVIGYETACGDPLFIDCDKACMQVLTAMHGEGQWHAVQVASSMQVFRECVQEFSRLAAGRSNPAEQERDPVKATEREAFLKRVAELNETDAPPEFWDVLSEC